jgi:hypothetical protein
MGRVKRKLAIVAGVAVMVEENKSRCAAPGCTKTVKARGMCVKHCWGEELRTK